MVKGKMDVEEVLTVSEVAAFVKLGRCKIYRLVKQRRIPFSRIDKSLRFQRSLLLKWLRDNGQMPDDRYAAGGRELVSHPSTGDAS